MFPKLQKSERTNPNERLCWHPSILLCSIFAYDVHNGLYFTLSSFLLLIWATFYLESYSMQEKKVNGQK
jgi:hypothetical protein